MEVGICRKDFISTGGRFFEEICIFIEIGQAKLGQAALADTEQVSGPPWSSDPALL